MGLKFSQRIGKTPVREALQAEGMDKGLENGLWNDIYHIVGQYYENKKNHYTNDIVYFSAIDIYEEKIDEIPEGDEEEMDLYIKEQYIKSSWFQKYDLIEYICSNFAKAEEIKNFNKTLEKHQSAYRIINHQVTPIISNQEIQTIETALENPSQAVTSHLDTALQLLSDRQNPDYRNSIKESISAVESYCLLLTNNTTISMNKAMERLKKKHGLNNVLEKAFISGWMMLESR